VSPLWIGNKFLRAGKFEASKIGFFGFEYLCISQACTAFSAAIELENG
jgi:hypothetical protein